MPYLWRAIVECCHAATSFSLVLTVTGTVSASFVGCWSWSTSSTSLFLQADFSSFRGKRRYGMKQNALHVKASFDMSFVKTRVVQTFLLAPDYNNENSTLINTFSADLSKKRFRSKAVKWYTCRSSRPRSWGRLGSIRFSTTSHRRLEKRYLRPVQPRARCLWVGARKRLVRGAIIDSTSVQHSLWKYPRGPWRKQAELGAADHSWPEPD